MEEWSTFRLTGGALEAFGAAPAQAGEIKPSEALARG
jgi:hypothetical protein